MKILVITNASLDSEKFIVQNEIIRKSAAELGVEIEFKNNTELFFTLPGHTEDFKADAVLFYDKDFFLCRELEKRGYKVFNSSEAISSCDNKVKTYEILSDKNIKIPKTVVLPLIYYYKEGLIADFIKNLELKLSYPIVAKKWYGSEGKQVFLVHNREELLKLIESEQGKELLFQQFFPECSGEDVRIVIIGGKFVASMKRKSTSGDFRSNLSSGGTATAYSPSSEEIQLAISASNALGLDFCGVDILQTNSGAVICEVNSNSHLKNIYDITGVNVAKNILKYIISKI